MTKDESVELNNANERIMAQAERLSDEADKRAGIFNLKTHLVVDDEKGAST